MFYEPFSDVQTYVLPGVVKKFVGNDNAGIIPLACL